jgi:hypothetical protein
MTFLLRSESHETLLSTDNHWSAESGNMFPPGGARSIRSMGPERVVALNRELLRHGEKDSTTGTDVADGIGIYHLGRFAWYYRALFGESPSETLQA